MNKLFKKLLCATLALQMVVGGVVSTYAVADEDTEVSEVVSESVELKAEASPEDDLVELMSIDPAWVKVSDNKPVFASAYRVGNDAYFATDGDISTSFVSAKQNLGKGVESKYGKMNERFVIDLMKETSVAAIKMQVASGCGNDVLIYVGNDNEFNTKTKIFEGNISDSAMDVITVPESIAANKYRYVIVEKNEYTTFAISEIEVYSPDGDAAEVNNVRRVSFGKTTYANNRGGYAGINLKNNPVNISDEVYLGDVAQSSEVSHFFFVDLGAEYEVPYVTMSAGIWREGNTDGAAITWRKARTDIEIVATNDPNFATSSDNDVVLYKYDGEFGAKSMYGAEQGEAGVDSGMALFENKDHKGEKFRYIGVRRTKEGKTTERLVLSTFNVYAGGIMVENLAASKVSDNAVNISADITGLNTSGLTALVTAFDDKGICVGTKANTIEFNGQEKYEFLIEPTFDATVSSAEIMLINGLDDFKVRWYNMGLLGDEAEMPTPSHTPGDDADNKNFVIKNEGDKVFIYGTAKYDYLTAMIIKPTDRENPINFDNLTEAVYDSSVIYMMSYETKKDNPYEFKAVLDTDAPIGTYYVKLFYPDGTSEKVSNFYYFSEGENTTVTGLLKNAKATEVLSVINDDKYAEAFSDCSGEIEKCGEDFGDYFVLARSIMQDGTFSANPVSFTDYTQFKDVIRFASMLNALAEREDYMTYVSKYKNTYMSKVFDKNYKEDKFEKLYSVVRGYAGEINTAEDISNCVKKAIALGLVYNGSQNDIKTALKDYNEYIGVQASEISESGYTEFEIAKYIAKTFDDVKGYAKSGMSKAVESAIKKVKAEEKKNNTKHVGGGISGAGNTTYEVPVVLPETKKEPTVYFNDLGNFGWAEEAILNLAEKKIILGDGKGDFKPENYITREEVVKLVVEMFEITTTKSDDLFVDCVVTDWYYPYVMAAKYNKIVKGVSETRFGAGEAVSRQDLATILRRAMSFVKYEFSSKTTVEFTDENDIDMYAVDGVLTLAAEGIVNGFEDGSFRPHDNTTRAEAAVMINRVYENYQKQQIAAQAATEEE